MLGRTLANRYKLTRILGAGGFGQTYLAIDIAHSSRPRCVVKQLKPASQDSSFLSVARRLFDAEAKTLERLGSHTQIPQLLGSFEEDHEFYLVQEFIDGQSLEEEITQNGKLSEAQAIALLENVLPVLQFVHSRRVLHRDLKPDNLIRRKDAEEIVLIDFGAVKEMRSKLFTGEQTKLTIGIGTQGYTPSEQLAGKPRYSSDIYALGMTVIHALTGRSPLDFPEVSTTLEPQWQDYADVSPGFAILLGKMTRHYIHQRYQSVEAVQHDLSRLEELPAEAARADTYIETSIPEAAQAAKTPPKILRWQMSPKAKCLTAAIAATTTSALVLGLRQIGFFVPAELAAYDLMVRTQQEQSFDDRLLIVEITKDDIASLDDTDTVGSSIAEAIERLHSHQPANIGLNILPTASYVSDVTALYRGISNFDVVSAMTLEDIQNGQLKREFESSTSNHYRFNNVLRDTDFRVRRSLLSAPIQASVKNSSEPAEMPSSAAEDTDEQTFSFGIELALRYLQQMHNMQPEEDDILQIAGRRFLPISPTFGGYQNVDDSGYQVFLRYRSKQAIARRLSLRDILNNNFDPEIVKDRVVLIGPDFDDLFPTPYNNSGQPEERSSTVLHAQLISQILSAVLDGKSFPWVWPDALEICWVVGLTVAGGTLMVLTQRGLFLILFGVGGLTGALLISVFCFQSGGWVPVAAPASAFFLSAAGARISKSYQRRYWETKHGSEEKLVQSAVEQYLDRVLGSADTTIEET